MLIFWAAHVYSHGLGESLNLGRRLTASELRAIGRRESPILLAGVLPGVVIVLGALGVLGHTPALWLATGVGVATLTIQGVRYALLERLSRVETMLTITANLALGLVTVVLQALPAH